MVLFTSILNLNSKLRSGIYSISFLTVFLYIIYLYDYISINFILTPSKLQ